MRKDKPCTGKKFGGASCPPGSKRYNLAKTFKKWLRKEANNEKCIWKIFKQRWLFKKVVYM